MKLYTEEQLLNTIKSVRHYDDWFDGEVADERIEKHLKALAPIELPTDEEIEKYVKSTGYYGHCTPEYHEGIEEGAKWVIEQIKNKINENNNY